MRRFLPWLIVLVALPFQACAEPSSNSTVIQAEALAPWWVWWLVLGVFSFVAYPLLGRWLLRVIGADNRTQRMLVHLMGGVAFLLGVGAIVSMFLASIGWSTSSPWWFIGAWAATVAVLSCGYFAGLAWIARRKRASPA